MRQRLIEMTVHLQVPVFDNSRGALGREDCIPRLASGAVF